MQTHHRSCCWLLAILLLSLPEYSAEQLSVSKCELCEIALEEGHKRLASVMGKKRNLQLREEFEQLRDDSSVWVKYDPDWRNIFSSWYFDNPKHWESIMWKFQTIYGASDFEKQDLAKSHGNAGKIDPANVYDLWKKECVEISGFCKDSEMRQPAATVTQCGVCRSTVREVYIRLRRFAQDPSKVTMGLVDGLVEDSCQTHLFHNPRKEGAKMQSKCEELLEDMDGAMVKGLFNAVKASGDWAEPAPGFTDAIAKQVCLDASDMCSAKSFEASTAEAGKSEL